MARTSPADLALGSYVLSCPVPFGSECRPRRRCDRPGPSQDSLRSGHGVKWTHAHAVGPPRRTGVSYQPGAHSSVWLERFPYKEEVGGSNPSTPTTVSGVAPGCDTFLDFPAIPAKCPRDIPILFPRILYKPKTYADDLADDAGLSLFKSAGVAYAAALTTFARSSVKHGAASYALICRFVSASWRLRETNY